MVIVPCYLGEERRKELIDTLADQQGDFIAVVYLNGSLEKFSEHTYKKMLTTIKKYAKKSKRILIIGHLYDEKPRL
ncbi:MAG: hypothetical protein LBG59_05105 [Candidatus Peribacteria bacterium]|jgi:quinolinate synthase|nr:hypothetical protein [Candidatus Peribacteria bacterium]